MRPKHTTLVAQLIFIKNRNKNWQHIRMASKGQAIVDMDDRNMSYSCAFTRVLSEGRAMGHGPLAERCIDWR